MNHRWRYKAAAPDTFADTDTHTDTDTDAFAASATDTFADAAQM